MFVDVDVLLEEVDESEEVILVVETYMEINGFDEEHMRLAPLSFLPPLCGCVCCMYLADLS